LSDLGWHRRLLGVEDGSFEAFPVKTGGQAYLCCVVMEGASIINVRLTKIHVDGLDATEALLGLGPFNDLEAIILGGVTFAGFNIIDPFKVNNETGVPVIVYSGSKPDNDAMLEALQRHFGDWRERWEVVKRLGRVHEATTFPGEPQIYFEVVGEEPSWAEEILRDAAMVSRIPEPVRAAGLIARGLS
jgi:endonuclease V-like protein UPF0215 family